MFGKLKAERHLRTMSPARAGLTNPDVSVFSSNCVGGVICHDLGMRFSSPTVNLFMVPQDFVRLASDPERYLALLVEPVEVLELYPVGRFGDLTLHFVHYGSFAEAESAWQRRCSRVDLANSRWILVDRDGLDEETARAFGALPLTGKALLSHRKWEGLGCCVSRPEWAEPGRPQTRDLCAFGGGGFLSAPRRYIDGFDHVAFLNEGIARLRD